MERLPFFAYTINQPKQGQKMVLLVSSNVGVIIGGI